LIRRRSMALDPPVGGFRKMPDSNFRFGKRWSILAAAVLMQMCLGATYAWSVFVQPIRNATGAGQGVAQIPFSVFYFLFPLTMAFMGSLSRQPSPRRAAVMGGWMFGGGWILAGLGGNSIYWTVAGIGVVGGIGVGLAYIVPISVAMAWFPRHRGLVTGIAVAGFGGGAALVGKLAAQGIRQGISPYTLLLCFGIAFQLVIPLAAMAMQLPAAGSEPPSPPVKAREVLTSRAFLTLFLTFGAGLAAGLTVNANLKHLNTMDALSSGAEAVAWFALSNAAGRIVWGRAFDRFEPALVLALNLIATILTLGSSFFLLQSSGGVQSFAALSGFQYGGLLAMHPAFVARLWNRANLNRIYGWLFTAHLPATFMPSVAGWVFDRTGSLLPALLGIAVLVLIAALAILSLRSQISPGDAA